MPGPNPDVDAILEANPDARRVIFAEHRGAIHAGDPEIVEVVKWRKPSSPLGAAVFEHEGIVCIVIPLKGRFRISLVGASLPDPKNLFNAQLRGKSRAIDFPLGMRIDAAGVEAFVRAAVKRRTRGEPSPRSAPEPRSSPKAPR